MNIEKFEEDSIKKLKPLKPKMKVSGKSSFLLAKLSVTQRQQKRK